MSELLKRITFAVPAAALFIFLMWMGGWYFKGLIIVIGFFIQHEMIKMLDKSGTPTDIFFPYTIGLWIMLSQDIPYSFEIGLGIFLLFIAIQTFNASEFSVSELTATMFAGIYAPLGLLCLMMIDSLGTKEQGFALTLILAFMVWGNDVFAYFGGKTFGKHALAPSISPNKTWEGFFFGYIGSLIGAFLIFWLVPVDAVLNWKQLIPMAMLVATFGPIGDLLESKLKRKAGVKNSSFLLPGHGGLFDRFDAFIPVAPVGFIYVMILEGLGIISF